MASPGISRANRGYFEIIHSILEASLDRALKTHIMFRCNLNSRQVQAYVQFLTDKRLLAREHVPGSTKVCYTTTDLGRRYIRAYEELVALVGPRNSAGVAGVQMKPWQSS